MSVGGGVRAGGATVQRPRRLGVRGGHSRIFLSRQWGVASTTDQPAAADGDAQRGLPHRRKLTRWVSASNAQIPSRPCLARIACSSSFALLQDESSPPSV